MHWHVHITCTRTYVRMQYTYNCIDMHSTVDQLCDVTWHIKYTACTNIYAYNHIHTYVCIYCVYILTYTYMYTHTCVHMYSCIPVTWYIMYILRIHFNIYIHVYTYMCTIVYLLRDPFICVTRLVHMCDMTHSYVWHDSFICVYTYMCTYV